MAFTGLSQLSIKFSSLEKGDWIVMRLNSSSSKSITLVLGGVRSGKSLYAQNLVTGGGRVAFIATAEARDEDMRQRINRHRSERPASWTTVEEPIELEDAILRCSGNFDITLVDCLTLWTSNLMMTAAGHDSDYVFNRADRLCESLRITTSSVVLVSNEVGSGIVPMSSDGRLYRDLLGGVNQRVAAVAARVLLLVAGYPLTVKETAEVRS